MAKAVHPSKDLAFEELEEWLSGLIEDEALIIVEGKRDRSALISCGIDASRIVTIDRPLYAIVERVSACSKKVVILTDLDSEGKKLYGSLKHDLCQQGVYVDKYFREFLFKNTGVKHIEGLYTYLRRRVRNLST
jgi:5S rRNA maturation endonuclease (ribonuclease M5)